MKKHRFSGKSLEDAINTAKISLQEVEENLIIKEIETVKGGLFKAKKTEIEVIEKREIPKFIKETIISLLRDLGYSVNVEIRNKEAVPNYVLYSDNDALLIGKNGKNLQALSIVISQIVKKEIGESYKFLIDVNDYKEKHQKSIESLARKLAREVKNTKIEVKMDSMNSYERRIVHNVLTNFKHVYTESVGEEPNRCVVIKPKED